MTVTWNEADLELLKILVPSLKFDDAERRAAILESGTRDFNAVPGSGKTSLLAAKLVLLARKWPHARRGVCVLSHTNVAREEIEKRLTATPDGARLLGYPHYIGTIHGFVNQFIAVPFLRSNDHAVDIIDDDVFAARAIALAKRDKVLRFRLEKDQSIAPMVASLFFSGADLELKTEKGSLPKEGLASLDSVVRIKERLTEDGVFRFRDMFAYAEAALKRSPQLLDILCQRFPMVFIDEMQDTSWEQESLLNRLFKGRSVLQRYGDSDQKLLTDTDGIENLTFPHDEHLSITTSKRFGPVIARAVGTVRVSKKPVVGEGADGPPPVLLVYETTEVKRVIDRFGEIVLDSFPEMEIPTGAVRALCARKSGAGNVDAGRHIVDYWPAFYSDRVSESSRQANFWALVSGSTTEQGRYIMAERAADVRRALLLVLRDAKAEIAADLRDARRLSWLISNTNNVTLIRNFRRLVLFLAMRPAHRWTAGFKAYVPEFIFRCLAQLIPEQLKLEQFKAMRCFEEGDALPDDAGNARRCDVTANRRTVSVELGTTLGAKGETHLATLVLQSYGLSRRFDLALALPNISELQQFKALPATQANQYRNLYVAMSRPTSLLVLAANEAHVTDEQAGALAGLGWRVEYLRSPPP